MAPTAGEGIYTKVLGLSIRREEEPTNGNPSAGSGHHGLSTTSTIQSIRVTLTYPTSADTNVTGRQLLLRLTSDSDPLFFYHLRLGELEYPILKQNQGLLVDFAGFPAQLISLLDKCGDDKFQLVLRNGRDMTILDIVESNPFKYLAHLSLFVVPGSDSEVKRYLAQVTTDLKKENEGMKAQIQHMYSSLQMELARNKEEMEKRDLEVARLKEKISIESTSTSEKYFRDISSEKEKFIKFQTELTTKFETEKSELERKHRENLTALDSDFRSVENEKRQLEQEAFRTNSKLKDYESRLKSNEDDMRILNQELQILRKNNSKLDADYHEKHRSVANLTSKLTTLENEVKEKCGTIARQQDLITTLGEKVRILEEKSHNLLREGDQSKTKIREMGTELGKANDIIRKLQEDSRQTGKKIKTQNQMLASQDQQICQKSEELIELRESLKTMTCTNESLKSDLDATRQKSNELQEELKSQTANLESKQDMIDWLNKQLNEFQGLSSLAKFRQNLNESSNSKLGVSGGGGDAPSWMNIYNSTGTTAGGCFTSASRTTNMNANASLPNPRANAGIQEIDEAPNSALSQVQRQPIWTKSSKVTINPLNKINLPVWKK